MAQKTTLETRVSIVIPVYNESAIIADTIERIRNTAAEVEIIIADGGPGHQTLEAVADSGSVRVVSRPGRGRQMNAGAAMASGDILLFLHADTELPPGGVDSVRQAVLAGAVAGAFRLSIASSRWSLRLVAWCANLRSALERVPYGDQGQFIRADLFRELGGFAEIPIMEDVELFQRIRAQGLPIVILPGRVRTSSRRWDREGVFRRTAANWWLRFRYWLGVSPDVLVKAYRPHDEKVDGS